MSDHRPPDAIEPPDPFEGLVLDEEFVRSATVSEPSARARMLAERWRHEPPVDPGGRRWSPGTAAPARGGRARRRFHLPFRSRSPRPDRDQSSYPTGRFGRLRRFGSLSRGEQWTVALGLLIVLLVVGGVLFEPQRAHTPQLARAGRGPGSPAPSTDRALPGGGVFTGSRCGTRGYHRFPTAPAELTVDGSSGPALLLSAYGYQRLGADRPGEFVLDLRLSSGSATPLALSAPLGTDGVAVEIEGPDGLVAAAYGLPAAVEGAPHAPDGQGWLISAHGATAHAVLPVAALCPGVDPQALASGLMLRTDGRNTVTGPAPYTLTVSVSDPKVAELRRATGVQPQGEVLAVTNQIPVHASKPV
ncbi:SCO2583/SCO2584 N-terminal domain-containing protein [Kitasatospora griseola]|uniref:SCO2583/SCO2584 N-terminal domain-containing protein n=1 Tax=Kitasatospora griseola TaxID=2064 RepID=UPI00364F915B